MAGQGAAAARRLDGINLEGGATHMPNAERNRTVHLWSLSEDVVVRTGPGAGEFTLSGPWGEERLGEVDPAVGEALRRMELGPMWPPNLAPGDDDPAAPAWSWLVLMPELERVSHLIVRTLGIDDLAGPLLSAAPVSRYARFGLERLPVRQPVWLAPDVSLSRRAQGMSLEASGALYRVLVHRPEVAWVVGMLAWPVTPEDASASLAMPAGVAEGILDYLVAAGIAARVEDGGAPGPRGLVRPGEVTGATLLPGQFGWRPRGSAR
ncbi:NADH oxidase [Streptomyces sp. NPDC085524]|uniref:NADH oxidase n=1 Tax=unclassified Streptomyces TaxID=2593676 RepID=UPI0035E07234